MAARFLKVSSNGNKIFKSKLMTAPSYKIIFNFSFPFSIGGGGYNINTPYTPSGQTPILTPYNTPGPSNTPR